jgi:hypothetical protein
MVKTTIVTASVGNEKLIDCIESVRLQSMNPLHIVVVDGYEYLDSVIDILESNMYYKNENQFTYKHMADDVHELKLCVLPNNVGSNGYYAHRVIASFAHLINTEYCMFLDEDNTIDKDHVETCFHSISNEYDYVFSLRKIMDVDGEYICDDLCESLGTTPIYNDISNGYLIDTSAYFYRTSFLVKVAHLWHGKWGADRRFLTTLNSKLCHTNFACTDKRTLNYRLGGNEGSVQKEFFLNGNKLMEI